MSISTQFQNVNQSRLEYTAVHCPCCGEKLSSFKTDGAYKSFACESCRSGPFRIPIKDEEAFREYREALNRIYNDSEKAEVTQVSIENANAYVRALYEKYPQFASQDSQYVLLSIAVKCKNFKVKYKEGSGLAVEAKSAYDAAVQNVKGSYPLDLFGKILKNKYDSWKEPKKIPLWVKILVPSLAAVLLAAGLFLRFGERRILDEETGIVAQIKKDSYGMVDKWGVKFEARELVGDEEETVSGYLKKLTERYHIYDISVKRGSQTAQPSGAVKIKIPLPSTFLAGKTAVYHITESGTLEPVEATIESGFVEFEANHFSFYAIAELPFTVSFDSGIGVDIKAQSIMRGKTVTEPQLPERVGYTFLGWYDGETKWDFDAAVIGDVSLVAKWKANEYKLSLDYNDGTASTSNTVTYDSAYEIETPTRPGYTFLGWYYENGNAYKKSDVWNHLENVALIANWKIKECEVTFNPGNGSLSTTSKTVVADFAYGELPTPVWEGHSFVGWVFNDEIVTDITTVSVEINHTLVARWENITYDVTFNSNGGTNIDTQTISHGEKVVCPTNISRVGYEFVGWYKDRSFTEEFDFQKEKIYENLILYAKWNANSYSISFSNPNGEVPATVVVKYDGTISLEEPTRSFSSFYTFDGWYYNGNKVSTAYTHTVAADITLTAQWVQVHSDFTYIYDADGLARINDNKNGKYMLICDIDLTGRNWSIITNFNGTLCGNGFSIYGLSCSSRLNDSGDTYGMFKNTNGATFKDINLKNVAIMTDNDNNKGGVFYVGALIGEAYNTTITNVSVSGWVKLDGSYGGTANVGGIVGKAVGCRISQCKNSANVLAAKGAANAGGIAGTSDSSSFSGCSNSGEIDAHLMVFLGHARAGGITGYETGSGAYSSNSNTGALIARGDAGATYKKNNEYNK